MGEEAQERRLATSTCPKATIPYERLLLYVHPPPDMVTDSMIRLILIDYYMTIPFLGRRVAASLEQLPSSST